MASYDPYVPYALQMERDTGIPAAIILGQAMLEGGASLSSGLIKSANNFFGIKGVGNAGSVYLPTKEQDKSGRVSWENARFKKYASPYDSFMDHAALLQKPLYQAYLKDAKTLTDWVKGIHNSPYATDVAYDKKLMNVITSNNLDQIGSVPIGDYMSKIGQNPSGGTVDINNPINTGLRENAQVAANNIIKWVLLLVLFVVGILFLLQALPVEKTAGAALEQAAKVVKPVKAVKKVVGKQVAKNVAKKAAAGKAAAAAGAAT